MEDSHVHAELRRIWDGIALGQPVLPGDLDPTLTETIQRMHALTDVPDPDPAYAKRLRGAIIGAASQPIPIAVHTESSYSGAKEQPSRRRDNNLLTSVPVENARRAPGRALRPTPRSGELSPATVPQQLARPWRPRLELGAAVLAVVVLSAYLFVANHSRQVVEPPRVAGIVASPTATGTTPVRLRIAAIGVDAPIAPGEAADDQDILPTASDRSVVTWRENSAALGERGNVVLDGNLDWSLAELADGDLLDIVGANRSLYSYELEWVRRFPLADNNEQVQEVVGPTGSGTVTILTRAGELDRATQQYPDVVVVRARLLSSSSLPSLAVPAPEECQVDPRSIEELDDAWARITARPSQIPSPTVLSALERRPADAEVMAAITVMERELVSCLNANDARRTYALFTDDGLVRLFDFSFGGVSDQFVWTPDFSDSLSAATPVPTSDRLALLAIEEVSLLADGRIAADVTIGPRFFGAFGVPTGVSTVHIFTFEPGEGYRIDEIILTPDTWGDRLPDPSRP